MRPASTINPRYRSTSLRECGFCFCAVVLVRLTCHAFRRIRRAIRDRSRNDPTATKCWSTLLAFCIRVRCTVLFSKLRSSLRFCGTIEDTFRVSSKIFWKFRTMICRVKSHGRRSCLLFSVRLGERWFIKSCCLAVSDLSGRRSIAGETEITNFAGNRIRLLGPIINSTCKVTRCGVI